MKWRVAALVLSLSLPAAAQTADKKACLAAVDDGQRLRDEGKLSEAREKFLACAAKGCAPAVIKQCDEWVTEVERDLPTVLFRAKAPDGHELIDVRVLVDGAKVADAIPAQPLPLDPQTHAIRFEAMDGSFVEDRILLRVGEKSRMIELTFPPPAAPPEPPPPPPVAPPPPPPERKFEVPLLGWIGGGVFVAGAATTAVFAIMASSDESELRSTCAPSCAAADRDAIQTKLTVANVGMFVGLAGLGVAVVTTILANRHPDKANAGYRWGVLRF